MRYAFSGSNTTILTATVDATGGTGSPGDPTALMTGINALGQNHPSGRTFWLTSFWAYDASAAILLHLFDATQGVDATGSTRRALIQCASGATTMVDWRPPGLKFITGFVVSKDTTTASGCFVPGAIGGTGYYE